MKWLDLHVGGQKWGIYLVSSRSKRFLTEDGSLAVGRCFYEECRIYLAKEQDEQSREDTLLHELLHALLHVSGADSAYGGSAKIDERIVTALTPHLHRLLKDLGFRFPSGLWK